ncbi:MAG: hypothetical protein NVSMB55_01730 [Mycobacteriales bacterium]
MQGQQQAHPARAAEAVDEQVGGLGHPVSRRRGRELDARGAVVQGQQRLRRVAVPDQAAGEVGQAAQGSSWAVTTFGLALTLGCVGLTEVTVTAWAPA